MPVQLHIYSHDTIIGCACVEIKGRYWRITCKFNLPEPGRHFASIVLPEGDIPLGLLPMDGYLSVFKPIIRNVDIEKSKINVRKENAGAPVDIEKPFKYLNQLPQATLRQLNHAYYIVFTNQDQG